MIFLIPMASSNFPNKHVNEKPSLLPSNRHSNKTRPRGKSALAHSFKNVEWAIAGICITAGCLLNTFYNEHAKLAEIESSLKHQSASLTKSIVTRLNEIEVLAKNVLREEMTPEIEKQLEIAGVSFWARGQYTTTQDTQEQRSQILDYRWIRPSPFDFQSNVKSAAKNAAPSSPHWTVTLSSLLNENAESMHRVAEYGVSSVWVPLRESFSAKAAGMLWLHRSESASEPFFYVRLSNDWFSSFWKLERGVDRGYLVLKNQIEKIDSPVLYSNASLEVVQSMNLAVLDEGQNKGAHFFAYRSIDQLGFLSLTRSMSSSSRLQSTQLILEAELPPGLYWLLGKRSLPTFLQLESDDSGNNSAGLESLKASALLTRVLRNPQVWGVWTQKTLNQNGAVLLFAWGAVLLLWGIKVSVQTNGKRSKKFRIPQSNVIGNYQVPSNIENSESDPQPAFPYEWVREFQKPAIWLVPQEQSQANLNNRFNLNSSVGADPSQFDQATQFPLELETRVVRYLVEGASNSNGLEPVQSLHSERLRTLSKALSSSVSMRRWVHRHFQSDYWKGFPLFVLNNRKEVELEGILVLLLDQPQIMPEESRSSELSNEKGLT